MFRKYDRFQPIQTWGPFLESPDSFWGPESYFMSVRFTLQIQILLVFKANE